MDLMKENLAEKVDELKDHVSTEIKALNRSMKERMRTQDDQIDVILREISKESKKKSDIDIGLRELNEDMDRLKQRLTKSLNDVRMEIQKQKAQL